MQSIATTRILHEPETMAAVLPRSPWVWPLPRLDRVAPCIVEPVDGLRPDGIDLGYSDRSSSPELVPVFAACCGVITYAGTSRGSPTVCIDHAGGWSTTYADLEHVLATPTDRFRIGVGRHSPHEALDRWATWLDKRRCPAQSRHRAVSVRPAGRALGIFLLERLLHATLQGGRASRGVTG